MKEVDPSVVETKESPFGASRGPVGKMNLDDQYWSRARYVQNAIHGNASLDHEKKYDVLETMIVHGHERAGETMVE